MKKVKVLFAVLTLLTVLTACGNEAKPAKSAGDEAQSVQEVEVAASESEIEEEAEKASVETSEEKNQYGLTDSQMQILSDCLKKSINDEYVTKCDATFEELSLEYKPNSEIKSITRFSDLFDGDVYGTAVYNLAHGPEGLLGYNLALFAATGGDTQYFEPFLSSSVFGHEDINALADSIGKDVMGYYVYNLSGEYPENNLANAMYLGLSEFYETLSEEDKMDFWLSLSNNYSSSDFNVNYDEPGVTFDADFDYNSVGGSFNSMFYVNERTLFSDLIHDALVGQ